MPESQIEHDLLYRNRIRPDLAPQPSPCLVEAAVAEKCDGGDSGVVVEEILESARGKSGAPAQPREVDSGGSLRLKVVSLKEKLKDRPFSGHERTKIRVWHSRGDSPVKLGNSGPAAQQAGDLLALRESRRRDVPDRVKKTRRTRAAADSMRDFESRSW